MSERKADKLRLVAKESQERIAAKLFDPEKVLAEAARLAGQGYERFRVVQNEHPIELRKTKAAQAFMKALDRHGLKYDWEDAQALPGERNNESGYVSHFKEIVISW